MSKATIIKSLACAMALAASLPLAAETETIGEYTWTYDIDGDAAGISLQAVEPSPQGSLTIPSTLGGKPVTSIGEYAFYGCSGLTSVTIPDSVTNIGDAVFSGCNALTNMPIFNSVTSIGESMFSDCSGLTSVTIPAGITSIGAFAFNNCTNLTSVTIPSSVTSIGQNAFSGCSGLMSVTIPDSVTSIGYSAFSDCSRLTSVTIPQAGVCSFRSKFDGYSDLSVIISDGVTDIGNSAFSSCSGLTSVTIPDSVMSIGESAFSGCNGLTRVTIPDSVTRIGEGAFAGCSGLQEITIPFVGEMRGNSGSPNALFGYIFGSASYSGGTAARNPYYSSSSYSYEEITFYIPSNLKKVVLTAETVLGCGAFYNCSCLTSVTIPDSMTSIAESAFGGCNSSLFETTTIPGVKLVDGWAVGNMGTLSGGLDLTGVRGIGGAAFVGCVGLTSVSIPDNVSSIADSAFSGCSGLMSVTIPDSVTSIGNGTFSGCSVLPDISIPNSVTNIGDYAFAYCDGLKSVEIPNSVKIVGVGAFAYCNNLKSAVIPQCLCAVASTHDGIFYSGSYYYGVEIKGSSGVSCVFGCESMTAYSGNTYSGSIITYPCNPALTNIIVASGTTFMADSAFADCKNLQSVTIPATVTRIGDEVFKDCSSLVSLAFEGDAPDVGASVLLGTPRRLQVKVQEGTIGWSGGGSAVLPSSWCDRAIVYADGTGPGGGSAGGSSGSYAQANADPRYDLEDHATDRTIASLTIDGDTALDEFVLRDGKVYDSVLYVVNRGASPARLIMPSGHTYVTVGGLTPLSMPAASTNLVTITRVAADTFLVTRQNLEAVK